MKPQHTFGLNGSWKRWLGEPVPLLMYLNASWQTMYLNSSWRARTCIVKHHSLLTRTSNMKTTVAQIMSRAILPTSFTDRNKNWTSLEGFFFALVAFVAWKLNVCRDSHVLDSNLSPHYSYGPKIQQASLESNQRMQVWWGTIFEYGMQKMSWLT